MEDATPQQVVNFFNAYDLLDAMNIHDISNYVCNNWGDVLRDVDNDIIILISKEDIVNDKVIIDKLKYVCHYLQPKGYIGKEDAKKLLTDYIDMWMTKSF